MKIGTIPTGLLSPVAAVMKSPLAAGKSEAEGALTPVELHNTPGYPDDEFAAREFADRV